MRKISQLGFTMLELIVAVGIMAMLLAAGFSNFAGGSRVTRNTRRQADFEQIRAALEAYRTADTNSSYPTTLNQLVPNYLPELPRDPQTRAFFPANTYFPHRCVDTSPCGRCSSYNYSIPLEAAAGTSFLVGTPLGTITQTTAPPTNQNCNN